MEVDMSTMMTVGQAADYLGVSRTKVWKLIGEGILSPVTNPLDKRQKLVPAEQIERLAQMRGTRTSSQSRRPRFHSDGTANNPEAPRSDELEEYLRGRWQVQR